MKRALLFILFLNFIYPQGYVRDVNPFTVIINGEEIESPFTGGLNQPDPRFIDFNGDGILDCFVNDRDGYLQYWKGLSSVSDDSGNFIPKFELVTKNFQNINVGTWYAFHDFDSDGDVDILSHTQNTNNVSYWSNIDGEYELITNELVDADNFPVNGGQIVISAIADIDNDGIIDYFIGDITGQLAHYKGHGFVDGLPQFELITNSFEDIWIVWTPGRHHGANAIEFHDLDDDGDLDIIWGDFYQPGLFYLENYGTATTPDFDYNLMIVDFPSGVDFETTGQNIARFADFDSDGDEDMVVGVLTGAYGIDYLDNLYYFQNNGTAESWDFKLISSRLLPGLDFISGSHPVVSKICASEQLRIWIGNEFNPGNAAWSGSLYTLEATDPTNDDLYLNYESIFQLGSNLSPGVLEVPYNINSTIRSLFIGDFNGTIFKVDEEDQNSDCYFTDPEPNFLQIDLSGRATPSFGDVDQDGDNDLAVGDKDGIIYIYWNHGSYDSASFDSVSYLFIDIGDNASPCVLKNGHILAGNRAGELYEITYLDSEELIAERRTDIPYIGRNLAPTAYYRKDESEPDLIFGTHAGGLQYFRYDATVASLNGEILPSVFELSKPYPNPFNNHFSFSLTMEKKQNVSITIVNLLGQNVQEIFNGSLSPGIKNWRVRMNLPSGIYFLHVVSNSQTQMQKLLLIK